MKSTSRIATKSTQRLGGFVEFIREQGIVGLAIGFVIGAAVAALARSLVDNIVMPPIGVLLGSADGIKGLSLSLGIHDGKESVLAYGLFLNDLINFLILALVVYVVVRLLQADKLDRKK